MESVLEYLKKQRDERARRLDAYSEALAELEMAEKKVDAFGDMGGIESEIDELDTYIEKVQGMVAAGQLQPITGELASVGENEAAEESEEA